MKSACLIWANYLGLFEWRERGRPGTTFTTKMTKNDEKRFVASEWPITEHFRAVPRTFDRVDDEDGNLVAYTFNKYMFDVNPRTFARIERRSDGAQMALVSGNGSYKELWIRTKIVIEAFEAALSI